MTPKRAESSAIATLAERIAIDTEHLDDALLEHSDLYYRVARGVARAQSKYDAAKDNLNRLTVQVRAEIREENKGRRLTAVQLEEALANDQDCIDAQEAVTAARRLLGRWQALKESYTQRSYMLRGLVDLYTAQYYTVSSANGTARTDMTRDRVRRESGSHYAKLAERYGNQNNSD